MIAARRILDMDFGQIIDCGGGRGTGDGGNGGHGAVICISLEGQGVIYHAPDTTLYRYVIQQHLLPWDGLKPPDSGNFLED